MRKSNGFTLIELLVVTGIIVVLVSLIMFGASIVRQSARRITCASNMRQVAMAFTSYSADFDGALPPIAPMDHSINTPGYARHIPYAWSQALVAQMTPYGFMLNKLCCPEQPNIGNPPQLDPTPASATYNEYICNYVYLAGLEDPLINDSGQSKFYEKNPSVRSLRHGDGTKILMGELNIFWANDGPIFSYQQIWTNHGGGVVPATTQATAIKALRGANRCYADGHIEWVYPSRMGNDDATPTATPSSARYSHWEDYRVYFW